MQYDKTPTNALNLAMADDYIIVTDPSDVVQTFMELTKFTVPHGYELQFYDETLQNLGFVRNERGNYWLTVGNGKSKTLFVAHLDTAGGGKPVKINHVIVENDYVTTDGTSILGADDRAGVTVLLYLVSQNVAGDYLLVVGEEVGCVGSRDEAQHITQGRYDRAIQFDRAGTSEIITHQMGSRTASRQFARSLAKEFRRTTNGTIQLAPSNLGIYTDTNELTDVVRECTNISIGYVGQHSKNETQDMAFLVTIARAAAKVNWECLPTKNEYHKPISFHIPDFDEVEYNEKFFNVADDRGDDKDTWEMWMAIESGEWDSYDLRKWVIYNPTKSAKIIERLISSYPTESLDIVTEVERGV